MRMWMIDPELLCSKHLRGEHFELHMTVGNLNKNTSPGLIETLCTQHMLEPSSIVQRHTDLAIELLARGGSHKSAMEFDPTQYDVLLSFISTKVDQNESLMELSRRCPDCAERIGGQYDIIQCPANRGPNGEYRKIQ